MKARAEAFALNETETPVSLRQKPCKAVLCFDNRLYQLFVYRAFL